MDPELKLFRGQPAFVAMTAKQRQIFKAAIDVFAEKGYANSSTHEIAQRAGVAEGNIFSKFENKNGLLHAIVDPVAESFFPTSVRTFAVQQQNAQYDSLEAFVTDLITNRIAFLQANTKVLKIFMAELLYNQPMREQLVAQLPANDWPTLYTTMDHLKTKGQLVDWPDPTIMRLIFTSVGGHMLGYLFFNQPLTEETTQQLVTALTKALRP